MACPSDGDARLASGVGGGGACDVRSVDGARMTGIVNSFVSCDGHGGARMVDDVTYGSGGGVRLAGYATVGGSCGVRGAGGSRTSGVGTGGVSDVGVGGARMVVVAAPRGVGGIRQACALVLVVCVVIVERV
jgi:hypothetical protein